MNINLSTKVSGRLQAQVFRNGKLIYDTGEQSNKLTDYFFTGSFGRYRNCCQVGTGNQDPVGGDTGLRGSLLGTQASADASQDTNTIVPINATTVAVDNRKKWTFGLGSVIGTVSEVILRYQNVGGRLAGIRALTKNNLGVPTSITLTAEDQLVIYHTLRTVFTDAESLSSTVFEGTTYNIKHKFVAAIAGNIAVGGWIGGFYTTDSASVAPMFDKVYFTSNADYALGTATLSGGSSITPAVAPAVASIVGNVWTQSIQITVSSTEAVRNNNVAIAFGKSSGGASDPNILFFSPAINKTNLMQMKFNFTVTMTRE